MNILLVTETYLPYITGVAISTDNIARFMLSRGHKVTLVCPKPIVKEDFDFPHGLRLIKVPSLPFRFYNNNATGIFPLTLDPIRNAIEREDFDIVHIQEPGVVGLSALWLAKKYKLPVVGALHFIPEQIDRVMWGSFEPVLTPFLNKLIKPIYNSFDEVVTPSNYFAKYLRSIGVGKKINIVSNGVDINLYKPGALNIKKRLAYGFAKNDVVFFFLGRLDRDKNVETLIRTLPNTNPNVKLLIVGKGTEKKYLQTLSKKLAVESKIVWKDYITESEMVEIYKVVNVFVIMSPYEGQSIVTLQAVASGLPVIAANAGALPELVTNGKNGFLVSTYDSINLASRMNSLAKSQTLRNKFGNVSRKISLKHKKETALSQLEAIYKKFTR